MGNSLQNERAVQLGARRDPELAIDPRQIRLDRLAGDEHAGRYLRVREPCRRELGDLELGRAQLVRRAAGCGAAQFLVCARDPWFRAEALEDLARLLERKPCVAFALQPAQEL